jgi:pimeloyl-ACP methyl ester carboxylesterase
MVPSALRWRPAPRFLMFFAMRPVLIPLAERLGRYALRRRGVQTRWMPTALGRVHVYDAPGKGPLPTTVLLHGISSSATPFGPVLARLRRHVRRVVAPDYPGHGFTPAPSETLTPEALLDAMTRVLDDLLDEPAIVVGNSLGGALALHYAIARPDRVRALVLVSPAGAPSTAAEWSALKGAFDFDSRAGGLEFLARVYHRTPLIARLVAHELSASIGRQVVRDLLAGASNEHAPTPEALAALPMPVLLVWGRSERLLPESHLDYYARHLPGRTVVERPEGFGHCAHVDQPGRVAERIVSFARGV